MQDSLSPALSAKLANMAFVCALLVVPIHLYADWSPAAEVCRLFLGESLCRIAVPFFFIAAGFFLGGHIGERRWWPREAKKRVRSLLVPYLIWNVLFFLYLLASRFAKGLPPGDGGVSLPSILGIGTLYFYPLWFLRALLFFVLVSWALAWPIKRGRRSGILLLAGLFAFHCCARAAYSLGVGGEAVAFFGRGGGGVSFGLFCFALGMFLRRQPLSLRLSRGQAAALALTAFVVCALRAWLLCEGVAVTACSRLSALSIFVTLAGVWAILPARPWPRWLTGSAFPIYLLHLFFNETLTSLIPWLAPEAFPGSVANYLGVWALAAAASICVAQALRRWAPRTAGVLFGGR